MKILMIMLSGVMLVNSQDMSKERLEVITGTQVVVQGKVPVVAKKATSKKATPTKKKTTKKKVVKKKTTKKKVKKKVKKINIKDLLIYKSSFYNLKSLEDSILYKNLNKESKYRSNLWNITLRNTSRNGKYEKLGYLNVGNKYEPKYTFFNMNKNLEYFSNPNKNNNECEKKGTYKRNLSLNIDDNLYNIKILLQKKKKKKKRRKLINLKELKIV